MLEFELMAISDDEILKIEKLRCEVFNYDFSRENNYYFRELKKGNIIGIKCLYDGKLIGGIYLSDLYSSLFVEQIFVSKNYQFSDLKVGSNLLHFIIDNKSIFEKKFFKKFNISRLESKNHDKFYISNGYVQENNLIGTMKRKI